ncbi:MAG: 3'(2'),5'-bisphosphate nucleotidase CysQ [Planctomycetes bacterium]|nr:3'(2'),5'-bisphosphate nucleotidase CysQ [Planctomycetota bacterium]
MTATPTAEELDTRLAFAAQIASEAGARLRGLRASGRWSDEKVLGDVADQAADGYLQGYLRGRHPEDGLLSEETKDSPGRLGPRYTWIVDPLDGTKEYRTDRHDWAVHVGLCHDGVPVLGAVALPAIDRVLTGVCVAGHERCELRGEGGDWPRELAPANAATSGLRIAVSRSHTPDWVQRFADHIGASELVPSGSVGFKVSLLLFGKADVYVHKTGLKEWDTCAPEAIARAAGWAVHRLDGSDQRYNQPDPRNDEILVCRPAVLERVLASVAAAL